MDGARASIPQGRSTKTAILCDSGLRCLNEVSWTSLGTLIARISGLFGFSSRKINLAESFQIVNLYQSLICSFQCAVHLRLCAAV